MALDTVLAGNSPWLKLKLVGEVAGRGGGGRFAEAQAGRVSREVRVGVGAYIELRSEVRP